MGEGRGGWWSATELRMRLGDWIWNNRGKDEDLQLAHLLSWLGWAGCSFGMPGGVGRYLGSFSIN